MTIIAIIVKSYFFILLGIGGVALLLFSLGLSLILKVARRSTVNVSAEKKDPVITVAAPVVQSASQQRIKPETAEADLIEEQSDIEAIAGEDPMTTQLDLARAYLESGKSQLAKIILEVVAEKGSDTHQDEAQRLLSTI
jgi:FimV-like protein